MRTNDGAMDERNQKALMASNQPYQFDYLSI